MPRKVFVSGSFDLLHSGHIAFLQDAAAYGDLYVALGSDATIYGLKGRLTINSEQERLYLMRAVGCVKEAFISSGSGLLDFEAELRQIQPDVFVVNEDGNTPAKVALCRELGIEYVVLKRQPHGDLPARSTTALRQISRLPYRIDLAGGWLDQPYVSKYSPGSVITLSIEPTLEFNERSGMATSTRNAAIDLWESRLPAGNHEKLAKMLFCYDNPPGKQVISGSQDSIGIVYPGLACAYYDGGSKPPVVLLHGLTGNGACWSPLARALEAEFDVVMPDARGHGESSTPPNGYRYEDHARDVVGLIQGLELAAPVLLGHSMGGMTAAVVASQIDTGLRGVILADPTFLSPARQREVYASNAVEEQRRLLRLDQKDVLAQAQVRHAQRSPELVELVTEARIKTRIEAFEVLTPPNPEYQRLVSAIEVPILLVIGDNGVVAPETARELEKLNSRLRVEQIEGAGHGLPYDQPERFAVAVKAFLRSL